MKKNSYIILVLSLLFCINNLKGQGTQYVYCLLGSPYAVFNAPTIIGASSSVTCFYAGEYSSTTLIAGNTYKIATKNSNFDPVLTIFHNIDQVGFNDDTPYGSGFESEINFTPKYTGTYRMQINEWGCSSNTLCSDLEVTLIKEPTPIITIPVVVHVVHYGEQIGIGKNISDAQILDQINVLNSSFNRSNSNFNNTPALFSGFSADMNVQFCLAQQDTNGIATSGILRYDASLPGGQASWDKDDCNNIVKPNTIWDRDKYLNIWVLDLEYPNGTLFGYAQFPPSLTALIGATGSIPTTANTDGVVMNYIAFGTNSQNWSTKNNGKTLVHEVGHWLGLLHPHMGCTTNSDFCDDTPQQEIAQHGCPNLTTADRMCNSTLFPVMYSNIMGYVDDACRTMLTYDQKGWIEHYLMSDRASLQNSQGCVAGIPAIYGCTTPLACNHNSAANVDDGSCDLPNGCGDPLYLEYSASVTCSDASACLTLIVNGCTAPLACNYNALANVDDGSCDLPNGCGDPLYLEYSASVTCSDANACVTLVVNGCVNMTACNYNALANVDDGSCDLPNGCGDPLYLEYSASVTCSDASACLTLIVNGCTAPLACNYDAAANVDDGSCDLPNGCGDPLYLEYDASVTCSDASACLTLIVNEVNGCTDSLACNYDVNATIDDASCYYSILGSIAQDGDYIFAATTPAGLNADWYNIQTENGTTRIWLMEEDASSFTPTFECSYFIVVSDNGCVDTSETYYFGATAKRIGSLVTSPNPTTGLINVKFENTKNQFVYMHLMNGNGVKLDDFITKNTELDIDISKYPSGAYYLYFNGEEAKQGCNPEDVEIISTKIILNK